MMNDLMERLRFNAEAGVPDFTNSKLLEEAATRIETLEDALRKIIKLNRSTTDSVFGEIARAALDRDERK